jgi:hypothetical protein
MRNKQTAPSASYKLMKPDTKDHQKSSYEDQTDNKENNDNIDMSMGLREEDKNKSKTKTMDQKEDKSSLPKEVATITATTATSSPLLPAQSEVFDSSSDNAMSEMTQVAHMGPDEASKVFSHVEEKQQLDPLTTSVDNDIAKQTIPENNLNMNPTSSTEPTFQERDSNVMGSKEQGAVLMKDVKPDTPYDHKELEQQNRSSQSVRFSDELNKEYHSASLNNDENNNPFISGIKSWQDYSKIWFNTYNEYLKIWKSMFKTIC